jgi:hypothetical protein
MATPEELYALQRIAEVESAIAALAKTGAAPSGTVIAVEEHVVAESEAPPVPAMEIAIPDASVEFSSAVHDFPEADARNLSTPKFRSRIKHRASPGDTERCDRCFRNCNCRLAFEFAAILDQHRVWVESGGESGTKADLCGANLENADLTGVNLQGAFLQRANLRGADLLHGQLAARIVGSSRRATPTSLAQNSGAPTSGATLWAEGLWLAVWVAPTLRRHVARNHFFHRRCKNCLGRHRSARWFYFLVLSVCAMCGL